MKAYLLFLWDKVRGSYWFLPSISLFLVSILSFLLLQVDDQINTDSLPRWILTTTDSSRATLSAITSAMIAVTGTVFSITIVTLSLTSQQFGPRLLRMFMLDLITQLTLSSFLSTSFYSLLILRVIERQPDKFTVPHLSVLFGVILMVISFIVLIIFFHHIAVMIQAPHIVKNVAIDLSSAIDRLYPDLLTDKACPKEEVESDDYLQYFASSYKISSEKDGYIQMLNVENLIALAKQEDVVIRFLCKAGNFINSIETIAETSGPLSEEGQTEFREQLKVGRRRTPRQDLECSVNELVEVAVRSLSSGINDPFTAISCIDWLTQSLCTLARRENPSSFLFDENQELRVILKHPSFSEIVDASFNQIRQNALDSESVTIKLLESLRKIAFIVKRTEDKAAVVKHIMMLKRTYQNFPEPGDRADAETRYLEAMQALEQGS